MYTGGPGAGQPDGTGRHPADSPGNFYRNERLSELPIIGSFAMFLQCKANLILLSSPINPLVQITLSLDEICSLYYTPVTGIILYLCRYLPAQRPKNA